MLRQGYSSYVTDDTAPTPILFTVQIPVAEFPRSVTHWDGKRRRRREHDSGTFQPEEDPTFIKRCRTPAKANHIRSTTKLRSLIVSGIPSFQYASDIHKFEDDFVTALSVNAAFIASLWHHNCDAKFIQTAEDSRIGLESIRRLFKPRWLQQCSWREKKNHWRWDHRFSCYSAYLCASHDQTSPNVFSKDKSLRKSFQLSFSASNSSWSSRCHLISSRLTNFESRSCV